MKNRMEKKLWNYAYSILLSIILLLLVGIFINLNGNNNKTADLSASNTIKPIEEDIIKEEQVDQEKRKLFIYDIIDQKNKDLQYFYRFVMDREKEVRGKVAIIIDDMGYQKEIAERIMNLNFPVAISVLPFLPHSQMVAQMAKEKGMTVLLHLPMEPHNSNVNPGKGAIFTTMNEEEIRAKMLANLQNLPYVDGINNHMGSKATENREVMKIVLSEIMERDIFFIDSMTSPDSIAYKLSKEMGIKTAQRSVFLDNEQDMDYIRNQVNVLKEFALKNGNAIAIGHPFCNTIDVLTEAGLMLQAAGIKIVKLEELLE